MPEAWVCCCWLIALTGLRVASCVQSTPGPVAGKGQWEKQGMESGVAQCPVAYLLLVFPLIKKNPRISRQSKESPVLGVLGSRMCSNTILAMESAFALHTHREHTPGEVFSQ